VSKKIDLGNAILFLYIGVNMSTMYIYDLNGSSNEEPIHSDFDIFRKLINPNNESGKTELEIAKRLLKCPKPNVVKVYNVVENNEHCWIDMECLEDKYVPLDKYVQDLKQGLGQLHTLGVVYIDIKADNIGYSIIDNVYKIFDFDCSGIVNTHFPKQWERAPYHNSFKYKNLRNKEDMLTSLYEMDALAFKMEYKRELS
jgi:serine/threonine protein kinase